MLRNDAHDLCDVSLWMLTFWALTQIHKTIHYFFSSLELLMKCTSSFAFHSESSAILHCLGCLMGKVWQSHFLLSFHPLLQSRLSSLGLMPLRIYWIAAVLMMARRQDDDVNAVKVLYVQMAPFIFCTKADIWPKHLHTHVYTQKYKHSTDTCTHTIVMLVKNGSHRQMIYLFIHPLGFWQHEDWCGAVQETW